MFISKTSFAQKKNNLESHICKNVSVYAQCEFCINVALRYTAYAELLISRYVHNHTQLYDVVVLYVLIFTHLQNVTFRREHLQPSNVTQPRHIFRKSANSRFAVRGHQVKTTSRFMVNKCITR